MFFLIQWLRLAISLPLSPGGSNFGTRIPFGDRDRVLSRRSQAFGRYNLRFKEEETLQENLTYRLLDCGEEQKLEQLGPYRVVRQAAQAHWPKSLGPDRWQDVHAVHNRSRAGGGHWSFGQTLPETWFMQLGAFRFKVKLTDFGHIGIFPEQRENWEWVTAHSQPDFNVLNLFGYTGGSTLAASAGGARVTHVDASRGVVAWGRQNAEASSLADRPIRWIVEDVSKYIAREINRGNTYQGLILDPPTYGRGPRGQVWKIEDHLIPLLFQLKKLMQPLKMILLSCHTPGYSPQCLENILQRVFEIPSEGLSSGEMSIPIEDSDLQLPSGTYSRWIAH